MNLQKEREMFEAWVVSNGRNIERFSDGSYKSMTLDKEWKAWQEAKAQAIPDGFVAVNKKDLVKVLNCVTDDWLVDTDSFEEFKKIESLVQDEVNDMIHKDYSVI